MNGRRIFSGFTAVLLALSVFMAWNNVMSDDMALRAHAGDLARKFAGCGDKCKVVGMHGDRGMIDETIVYDIDAFGQVVVTCRRPYIAFGEYECKAAKP